MARIIRRGPKGGKSVVLVEKDKVRGEVAAQEEGRKDLVYGAWIEGLRPRENVAMQEALAASNDPRFRLFLRRIFYKGVAGNFKLQTIAKQCQIDLKEFQEWWNKESSARAMGIAQRGSVEVVEDMREDARSVQEYCDRCDGMGWVAAPGDLPLDTLGYKLLAEEKVDGEGVVTEPAKFSRTCPKCEGKQRLRKPGDTHARDRLLEMAGHIKQKGAGVNIFQSFGGVGHASAVTSLASAMTIDLSENQVDFAPSGE